MAEGTLSSRVTHLRAIHHSRVMGARHQYVSNNSLPSSSFFDMRMVERLYSRKTKIKTMGTEY